MTLRGNIVECIGIEHAGEKDRSPAVEDFVLSSDLLVLSLGDKSF